MTEPKWLPEDVVRRLHDASIALHGGSLGVRDEGLLASALQRPQNRWAYENVEDPRDLAATYAVAISSNHPFIDGNKRAGFQALGSFLLINGWDLDALEDDATRIMLGVAAGEVDLPELEAWVRANARSL